MKDEVLEAAQQFLKELGSDAAIKQIQGMYLFDVPFKPAGNFPEYYSSDRSVIPLLGLKDTEGKVSAFFLTRKWVNFLAISAPRLQAMPIHPPIEGIKLILPETAK